nr:MAG TPA: hypothetical protein [Caudoviricetes sp.]
MFILTAWLPAACCRLPAAWLPASAETKRYYTPTGW